MRIYLKYLIILIAIVISHDVFAFNPRPSTDPIGNFLCDVARALRGWYARPIAIIAIIVLGIQGIRGKLSWQVALVISVGMIILFTAHDIVGVIIDVRDVCRLKCKDPTNPTCNWWQ